MDDEESKSVARWQETAADGNEKLKGRRDGELLFRHANFVVPLMELLEALKTFEKPECKGVIQIRAHWVEKFTVAIIWNLCDNLSQSNQGSIV